ncbi:MAG TPA: PepSY domain-containing protein [Megamonas hypermegale]|uniref:PepSY domain-containing protein n=1 Tax=Megamonas hypermegale TaxID=158847 RepID=A0A921HMK2_9FIRM|nr:PepSY domain-containing protein [Megamonas hypermegale]HJF85220.1 PepSY domain-containing protein [Megamonas hypermegale]
MKWFIIGVTVLLSLNVIGCGQSESRSSFDGVNAEFSDIDDKTAFMIALDDADVPHDDAYNIKVEQDGDNGIPVYDIEFETNYGDYDYEIAIENGAIVKADYEVDEQWLDRLGGNPVSVEEAKNIVLEKVPQASLDDIDIRRENADGRGRYEGRLFFNDMKYEFEIDPATGIIFDWNADLRR